MYTLALAAVLVSLPLTLAVFQKAKAGSRIPRFEDYHVKEVYRGKPAQLQWPEWPNHDFFRTSITELTESGTNFAGHYAIREWSCGTNCRWLLMIDLKTGKFIGPGGYGSLSLEYETQPDPTEPITFRANSRLLIASGCFDIESLEKPVECGAKYFVLEKQKFRQIHYIRKPTPEYFKNSVER